MRRIKTFLFSSLLLLFLDIPATQSTALNGSGRAGIASEMSADSCLSLTGAFCCVAQMGCRLTCRVKSDANAANRYKLANRLLTLSDRLSELETAKRNITNSLLETNPDLGRVDRNLQSTHRALNEVTEEVQGLRSQLQTQIAGGTELERTLTDWLDRKGLTINEMRRHRGANMSASELAELRREGNDLVAAIHKAQDALTELARRLRNAPSTVNCDCPC